MFRQGFTVPFSTVWRDKDYASLKKNKKLSFTHRNAHYLFCCIWIQWCTRCTDFNTYIYTLYTCLSIKSTTSSVLFNAGAPKKWPQKSQSLEPTRGIIEAPYSFDACRWTHCTFLLCSRQCHCVKMSFWSQTLIQGGKLVITVISINLSSSLCLMITLGNCTTGDSQYKVIRITLIITH